MKRKSFQIGIVRRYRSGNEKSEILREQQRSGLSLLGFARKRGLCYTSLLRWRSRQRNGAKVLVPSDTQADPRFVAVKIEGEGSSGEYVLSWAGGRSLKIPRGFEPESLRRLLWVLEGAR